MALTIADVARRAGVSTATVSRVLTNIGRARPETRERVIRAARDLGYRPSAVARSLKLRTTRTLGLVITDIENPFFPELVRAVEDAALERDLALLLCTVADDPEREASYLDLLVDRRVDGVVIASAGLGQRQAAWLARPPLPVVLVNCSAPGVKLPAVLSDNRAGGRLGADHLLALGHRTIGHLTAPPRHADANDRLAGCRDGLAGAGLDPEGMPVAIAAATVGGGEQAMRELLDREPLITGVTTYNDLMAIGALRAVRASGRRVPMDVSVVGFDDVSVAALVEPALTTIAQQTREMGRLAVERLAEQLAESTRPATRPDRTRQDPEVTRLPVELCVRVSTGPVPR
jgi:LacI family transcriptional regulator